MDVHTILDASAESVARAASTAADVVEHAVARVDQAVPLPSRKARRRRHLRGWLTRNRALLMAGGLGVVAAAVVAAKRRRAASGGRPSPGEAAMATSGAVTPEEGSGSTSEYAPFGAAGFPSADER